MLALERIRTIAILCLTVFGCTGNILILIVVYQGYFRKTASTVLISALSISDCIVLCLQSLQIVTKLHPQVTSYDCVLLFFMDAFRLLSVWLVCIINIERCSLVFNPCYMPRLTCRRKSQIFVIILCIISLLVFSHYAKHMHIEYVYNSNKTIPIRSFCVFKPNFHRLVWECIRSGLTYWFTVPVCIVCNLIIIHRLRQASSIERALHNINPGVDQLMNTNKFDLSTKQRQLTAMLLSSSICFVLTSTPSTIHTTYILITGKVDNVQYAIHILTNILLHFHHASNFLVFVFSSARFRIELMHLLRRYIVCQICMLWYKRSIPKTERILIISTKQHKTPNKLLTKTKESKRNVNVQYHDEVIEFKMNDHEQP
ncbi:unnamed protein product [Rotaria magnacalcarata]|uniref:G-protein coupled receptors family 1 profile domain-containing protein n=4 Tax=Rotaria magnacalcarata TaxID=392030 RepID=A0A814QX68_9BILA|nr:unnamed protein product [Rotaria magnacalcarata]CAF1622704.1 unnamed protein product [Rotaria magnacalcarata]CAF1930019.1 unnamed protein product [Rotaria magnacalcarata]CAF2037670.1 unnamed protein product [Rotaria magnacalcarata]CAF2038005.1 unnamed protein product [Rotaria magnacalcarata]